MIHGRYHRLYGFAVSKAENRDFRPGQKFFNYNLRAAFTKDFVFHDGSNCIKCLRFILCNHNAFSQCQAVCFNDSRIGILFPEISLCFLRVMKYSVFCSRNVILLHQLFGKYLASFQNSGIFLRAKGHEAFCLHCICHAQNQRIIRCNKYQINSQFFCQPYHAVNIGCLYREAFCILGNTAVSRCAVQCINLRTFCQLHDNGVLSSAAADH